jgi:hypothetical protein
MPADPESQPSPEKDRLETATDQAIAACGGKARDAVKAMLVANELLEAQIEELRADVSKGYARGYYHGRFKTYLVALPFVAGDGRREGENPHAHCLVTWLGQSPFNSAQSLRDLHQRAFDLLKNQNRPLSRRSNLRKRVRSEVLVVNFIIGLPSNLMWIKDAAAAIISMCKPLRTSLLLGSKTM